MVDFKSRLAMGGKAPWGFRIDSFTELFKRLLIEVGLRSDHQIVPYAKQARARR